MGRRPQDRRLRLPDALAAEIASASDPGRHFTKQKRQRSRKEVRKAERAAKKQRRNAHARPAAEQAPPTPAVASKPNTKDAVRPVKLARTTVNRLPRMPLKLDDDVSDIDAEIAMLEKKLGNSDKLKKELEDDGLEYLHDVIDNLGKASDTSDGDEQSGDDEVAMSDDDADDEERLVAIQEATEKRKRKQAHLYGDESVVRTESAYVPPHARAARVETGLTKMITGQLNRLSVDNIETIATTLKTVFESHPRGTLCDIIAQVSLGLVLSYRTTSPPPSIPALITYLTAHCGSEVAAGFLERLAPALVDARQSGTNDSVRNLSDTFNDDDFLTCRCRACRQH